MRRETVSDWSTAACHSEEVNPAPNRRSTVSRRLFEDIENVVGMLGTQTDSDHVAPSQATIRSRIIGFCCGRAPAVTAREKRLQVIKVLSVTLLPILGLWVFTAYSLNDSIEVKMDIEQTQSAVKFSVEIGIFLDRIQRERDMSVLYLSILGPETRAFLLNEYILTNEALRDLSGWPVSNDFNTVFQSKQSFQDHLNDHRNKLDPNNFNIYTTMNFYNSLIEKFVEWLYGSIRESSMASIWKVLVAYQKIVTGMEHIGIERALGTVFFVEGGLPQGWYERYNYRVNIFNANYRSAVFYSDSVDPVYQQQMWTDVDIVPVMDVIGAFRFTIQHSVGVEASIIKGQWWFDNMTVYLDRLLVIQKKLAIFINGELQTIIDEEEKNLTISACFLVFVIFMCPLVIYSVEALTTDIQIYAIAMVNKTQELAREKEKMDGLFYFLVPPPVANSLRHGSSREAEYFQSVTVLFSDIDAFSNILEEYSPSEIITFLETLNKEMDKEIRKFNVYKVETLQNSYMVVSGLPIRNGERHSATIAGLALTLVELMTKRVFTVGQHRINLRIGVDTGPCVAGVLGMVSPRYCVFGDIVSIAAQIKCYSLPNKIHLSSQAAKSLQKHGVFLVKFRGYFSLQGKGKRRTFWLEGLADKEAVSRILERQTRQESNANELIRHQDSVETQPDSVDADLGRPHKHYNTHDRRRSHKDYLISLSSVDTGTSFNGALDDPPDMYGYLKGVGKRRKSSNPTVWSQEDLQLTASSSNSRSAIIREAWLTDEDESKKGKDKKDTADYRPYKTMSLPSISERKSRNKVSKKTQEDNSGSEVMTILHKEHSTGDSASTNVTEHLASTKDSKHLAPTDKLNSITSNASKTGSESSSADDKASVRVFSRSSSLVNQMGAGTEVILIHPENSKESSLDGEHNPPSPIVQSKIEYPMHSHDSLPGAGDIPARLEWELQQSSWFLQYTRPSVRMKYTKAATSRCNDPDGETEETPDPENTMMSLGPQVEHKISYSSIEMSNHNADSLNAVQPPTELTPVSGSGSLPIHNPTIANSLAPFYWQLL